MRWFEALDLHVPKADAGGGAPVLPLCRTKSSSDGGRAIVLDKGMKPGQFGEDAEEMVGEWRTREIVDEPADLRVPLHPLQKSNNIVSRKMMSKERTDDKMNGFRRRVFQDICADPLDCASCRSGLGGNNCGVRVEVEASQFDGDAAMLCPPLDAAQRVTVTASNVENMKRLVAELQYGRESI